jgi:predicted MFS family arabinose efflux permease
VFALMKDPQVVKYSLTVNLPIYIYLMVIVVLIPGIIQTGGIPPVVLTYSNLLNGLAGLYIGVRLGSFLRNRIGLRNSIVFICAIGSAAVLMQALPLTASALPFTVAALILGAALWACRRRRVPLASDYFLELTAYEAGSTKPRPVPAVHHRFTS